MRGGSGRTHLPAHPIRRQVRSTSGPWAIKKPCIRGWLSGAENREVQSRCGAGKKLIFLSRRFGALGEVVKWLASLSLSRIHNANSLCLTEIAENFRLQQARIGFFFKTGDDHLYVGFAGRADCEVIAGGGKCQDWMLVLYADLHETARRGASHQSAIHLDGSGGHREVRWFRLEPCAGFPAGQRR